MADLLPYDDHHLDGAVPDGSFAGYEAHYEDYDDEPTEAQRAEAVEQFLADTGRFPGVGDSLDRARRAEIEADYHDETSTVERHSRRQPAGIEL